MGSWFEPALYLELVLWMSGDRFYMPFGSWYGHANPFDQPARILIVASHLDDNDVLNPFVGTTRTVPEQTFPGERRDPVPEDEVIEDVNWTVALQAAEKDAASMANMPVERRGPAKTLVFRAPLGASFNVVRSEMPLSYEISCGANPKQLRGRR